MPAKRPHERPRPVLPPGAGFARRTLATAVDIILFVGLIFLLTRPLAVRVAALGPQPPGELLLSVMASPPLRHLTLATALGLVLLWWASLIIGWGLWGTTIGKRLFGLAIIDHCGRHPIGPVRAQLRLVAYVLSFLPLGAGHFLVAFRSDHRALHDILAGTRVIRRRDLASLPEYGKSEDEPSPPRSPDQRRRSGIHPPSGVS